MAPAQQRVVSQEVGRGGAPDASLLEAWVVSWADKMCSALAGVPDEAWALQTSAPPTARSGPAAQGYSAYPRTMPGTNQRMSRTFTDGLSAVSALSKVERALQQHLNPMSPRSFEDLVSPRPSSPVANTTPRGAASKAAPSARATHKVSSSTCSLPSGNSFGGPSPNSSRASFPGVHKVNSMPATARAMPRPRFTEVLGTQPGSCTSEPGRLTNYVALSAIMASPRSSLMPDALTQSSPHVPSAAEGFSDFESSRPSFVTSAEAHARLDRMQDLLSQAQVHTSETLRFLRMDYKELERMRALDPNEPQYKAGAADACSDSSDSTDASLVQTARSAT